MAIRYKVDVLAELKKKGYSSTRIREEKLIGQSYLQQLRRGELVSWKTLDTICALLECQPGDLIEFQKEEYKKEGDSFFCCPPLGFYNYIPCVRPDPKIGSAASYAPMGQGIYSGKNIFESAFSKMGGQFSH